MTEIVDRNHAPRKRAYVDKRHDTYTTRKCTYRLLEDENVVTITVSPKGKRMVTHKATVNSEQFDELWFSEFRHRFESDLNYQRRFKVRRPPQRNGRGPARGPRNGPPQRNTNRHNDRDDRSYGGNSRGPARRGDNGNSRSRNYNDRGRNNRGSRPNQRNGGYSGSRYTSDRGS